MAEKLQIETVDVIKAAGRDLFAGGVYYSLGGKTGDGHAWARAVYMFRKFAKHADMVKAVVSGAEGFFGCQHVVPVPGHTTEKTSLQKIFGTPIARTVDTLSRKFDRGLEIDMSGVAWDLGDPRRVLVVDDFCVTGKTLEAFSRELKNRGFDPVCFALGADAKINCERFGSFKVPSFDAQADLFENDFPAREFFTGDLNSLTAKTSEPLTAAERVRKFVAKQRNVDTVPEVVDAMRREACRLDLVKFGLEYCSALLKRPPSAEMIERYIKPLQEAILHGGKSVVAIARSFGKTTWVKIALLWMICYNHRRYPVAIAARGKLARNIIGDIWDKLLLRGDELYEDFPELAVPVREIGIVAQRCKSQTFNGTPTGIAYEAERIRMPCLRDEAGYTIRSATGQMIAAVGVGGSVRGLCDGADRPDFILFDDIQKRGDAKSPSRIKALEQFVHSDALGLGGGDTVLSACMTITPIAPGDFAAVMLDPARHPEWSRTILPAVISWPKRMDLVEEFQDLYRADCAEGDFTRSRSTDFYREHRAEFAEGVKLLDDRIGGPGEVDALHHILNVFCSVGKESFQAEYQMDVEAQSSIVAVDADTVAGNLTGVPELVLPPGTTSAVAFCDANAVADAAFRVAVLAVGPRRVTSVPTYFRFPARGRLYPEHATEDAIAAAIARAVITVAERVRSLQLKFADGRRAYVRAMCFDGGWQTEAIARTVFTLNHVKRISPGFPVIWSRGLAWSKFNLRNRVKSAPLGDHCYESAGQKNGSFLAFHADYWRELAQKSFLAPALSPGSCSLFGADTVRHFDFAAEISGERLVAKFVRPDGRQQWDWVKSGRNHWLDVLVGCHVVASWFRLYADTTQLVDAANMDAAVAILAARAGAPPPDPTTAPPPVSPLPRPRLAKAARRYKFRFKHN